MEPAPRKRRLRPRYVVAGLVLLLLGSASAILYVVTDDPVTRMPPKSAIPAYASPKLRAALEALYSADPSSRAHAACEIARMEPVPPEVLPFLIGRLGDTARTDRPTDLLSWDFVKWRFSPAPFTEQVCPALYVAGAIRNMGEPAIEPVLAVLRESHDPWARAFAARSLTVHGKDPRALDALLAAARDKHYAVRKLTMETLRWWEEPAAWDAIIKAASTDPSADVREAAVQALWMPVSQYQKAAPALVKCLGDGDPRVCEAAARNLYYFKAPGVADALVAAMGHANAGVRRAAAASLQGRLETEASRALAAAMKDADAGVRLAAAVALECVPEDAKPDPDVNEALAAALEDTDDKVRLGAAVALANRRDRRGIGTLIGALKDVQKETRFSAAAALANIPDARSVEPLIVALSDPEFCVRSGAVDALAASGEARAVPAILPLAKDPQLAVRFSVSEALGELGDSRACDALKSLTNDEDEFIRYAALRSMMKVAKSMGYAGVARLIPLVKHNDPKVSKAVIAELVVLTSQSFGDDEAAWTDWWQKHRDDKP